VTRIAGARRPKCTLLSKVITLSHADRPGVNRLRVDRYLAPGSYLLMVTPRAAGKAGRTRTVSFTVER
jgi:hypothetical protein